MVGTAVGDEVGIGEGCVMGVADGIGVGGLEGMFAQHPHELVPHASGSNCPPTAMHDALDE